MPITETPMRGLYQKLDSAGIPASFAKRMLPSWWADEIAAEPAGLQQAQMYLARAFNIELQSLADSASAPRFRSSLRKYKLTKNVSEEAVSIGANYVTGVARLALQAFPQPQSAAPVKPADLRTAILKTNRCVDLPALVEWCLGANIPVLHIEQVPGKKMTGLVVRDNGRYAIVLSKKGHPAHLLFHLAHEIGHVAKGHLAADGFVVDEKIDSQNRDADEQEADAYAVCLLNGAELRYRAGGVIANASALHLAAVRKGKETHVDAGHIIANYGHNQDRYAMANLALGLLGEPKHGAGVINRAFFKALNREVISEDQLDLLRVATGFPD